MDMLLYISTTMLGLSLVLFFIGACYDVVNWRRNRKAREEFEAMQERLNARLIELDAPVRW